MRLATGANSSGWPRPIDGSRWPKVYSRTDSPPDGDLYLLNDRYELRRLKLGYSWATLAVNVESFFIEEFGTVHVIDRLHRSLMYSSLDRYHVLPAIPAGVVPGAPYPPSDFDAIQDAGIEHPRSGGQGRMIFPDALVNDVQYFPPGGFPFFHEENLYHWLSSPDASRLLESVAEATSTSGTHAASTSEPNEARFFWDSVSEHERLPGEVVSWNNVRMQIETVLDTIDAPRLYPNVGLAQLHHVQYKVTIYGETLVANPAAADPDHRFVNTEEQTVIYIDRDHLHRYVPGTPQAFPPNWDSQVATFSSAARAQPSAAASRGAGPAVQRDRDNNAVSLTRAPDGTLYKLGGGATGLAAVGSEPAPNFLWQLSPNSVWKPIDYVYSFAIAGDSTLYILDQNRVLRTPALGPTHWQTLAAEIETFCVASDGTLFALGANHELRTLAPGARQWTTLERGVRSLAQSPSGTITITNNRLELKQFLGGSRWTVLDRGVSSFVMVDDGAIYELNGAGELRRLRETQSPVVLARGLTAFQAAPDGGMYVLSARHELMKLTARDHWVVLERSVRSFEIAPNGDLYLISDRGELKRQKLGDSLKTLQTGVRSMTAYSDGSVYAVDAAGKTTVYSSLGIYYILPPVEGSPATDSPADAEVMRAANFHSPAELFDNGFPLISECFDFVLPGATLRDTNTGASRQPALRFSTHAYPLPEMLTVRNVRIAKERVSDALDSPRFLPDLGMVAMHRALFKCTVFYDIEDGEPRELTLFIDLDHIHFLPSHVDATDS